MNRSPRLAARRVQQTWTTFDNSPQLLWNLALARTRLARHELSFRLRNGTVMTCPNVAGARVPVYELFAEDAYRFEELTRGLPEDFVALDIGGQVGCFSVALATARPHARIHTYEASPVTVAWLRRNLAANGLADRVSAYHCAVSDHEGVLAFADNGLGSGLNGLTAPVGAVVVDVPCTTFAAAREAAGGRVDLVKIDTEGAEYSIVLASDPADWDGVRRVVLEHHPVPGRSWTELRDFLTTAGFRVVRHERADHELGTAWLTRDA